LKGGLTDARYRKREQKEQKKQGIIAREKGNKKA